MDPRKRDSTEFSHSLAAHRCYSDANANERGSPLSSKRPDPDFADLVSIIGVFNTCNHTTGRSTRAIAKIVQAHSVRLIACALAEELGACGKGNKACR